jgi:hypothetical protein
MMEDSSQLLKFIQICMQLATQHVPPYSSRFSKHTSTQPQLVVLYCLKVKLVVTYRELIDWLEEIPRIQQALGLRQLPHFTTVQKAFQHLGAAVWHVSRRFPAPRGWGRRGGF